MRFTLKHRSVRSDGDGSSSGRARLVGDGGGRGRRRHRAHGLPLAGAVSRPRARPGWSIAPRPQAHPAPHPGRAGRGDRGAAPAADDRRRDRRAARDAALDGLGRACSAIGLGKRSRLEPPEPPNRYERRHPGELVHVDIKKLGRIAAARSSRSPANRAARRTHRRDGRQALPGGRLGVRARRDRRPHPPGLRRGAARRARPDRGRRSCAARSPGSPPTASRSSA